MLYVKNLKKWITKHISWVGTVILIKTKKWHVSRWFRMGEGRDKTCSMLQNNSL